MTTFAWVSHRENFLLRPTADGLYEPHSDLVARVRGDGFDVRLVVIAGTARLKHARPGRARAALMRPKINDLPASPKVKDDLYLMALHADGARGLRVTKVLLRVRGCLRHLWKYQKRGGLVL